MFHKHAWSTCALFIVFLLLFPLFCCSFPSFLPPPPPPPPPPAILIPFDSSLFLLNHPTGVVIFLWQASSTCYIGNCCYRFRFIGQIATCNIKDKPINTRNKTSPFSFVCLFVCMVYPPPSLPLSVFFILFDFFLLSSSSSFPSSSLLPAGYRRFILPCSATLSTQVFSTSRPAG